MKSDNYIEEVLKKIFEGSKQDFFKILEENLDESARKIIVTANPEIVMVSKDNEKLKKCLYFEDTIIIPDGIGIVKAGKKLGRNFKETIPGVDVCKKLLEVLNRREKSLFLYGAAEDVIRAFENKIKEEYPKIKIMGAKNGYNDDKEETFKEMAKLKPDVILVALGVPEQEILIYDHINTFSKGIFIGVGGSFDVLSGKKKRAPKLFIKTHTEWLYRIVREPKRLRRFYKYNINFLKEVSKEKRRLKS